MTIPQSPCERPCPLADGGLSRWQVLQESKEATNFYFCYRWLLILFKREFTSYEEVSQHQRA